MTGNHERTYSIALDRGDARLLVEVLDGALEAPAHTSEDAAALLGISADQLWMEYKALHDRLAEMDAPIDAFCFTRDGHRLLEIALAGAAGASRHGVSMFPRDRTMRLAARVMAATGDDARE